MNTIFRNVVVVAALLSASLMLAGKAMAADFPLGNYGAVADGVTDDRNALLGAIWAATQAGGGTILIPNAKVRIEKGLISLGNNIVIKGTGENSELLFTDVAAGSYRMFFNVSGNGIRLQNLRLTRASNVYGVMVQLNGSSGFAMDNIVIDGKKDLYPQNDFHGVMIVGKKPALISDVRISRSSFRRLDMGVFQPSNETVTVNNFLVEDCFFEKNYADDLEFNAPNSSMANIFVRRSSFKNNLSKGPWGGFAVGFANVRGGKIMDNSFSYYGMNPVHIEDRSADVVVAGNRFFITSTIDTGYAAPIFVISGSNGVVVTENHCDTTKQSNRVDCIYVGTGGSTMRPRNITIKYNTLVLGSNAGSVLYYDTDSINIADNIVIEPGRRLIQR